jgi:hypothetical protein
MTKIKQHVYPYGKFYDADKEVLPGEGHYDIIVYTTTHGSTRVIGSIEGIFATSKKLERNPVVKREQMQDFENKYRGEFFPSFNQTLSEEKK